MQLRNFALSSALAVAAFSIAVPGAFAANPERDNDFAMSLAQQCDMDKSGMVSKASFMKMMEAKLDKVAKGAKELSVANTAKIFMDTNRASN